LVTCNGGELIIYSTKDVKKKKPQVKLTLRQCSVHETPTSVTCKDNSFTVLGQQKSFSFAASKEEEKNSWMSAISLESTDSTSFSSIESMKDATVVMNPEGCIVGFNSVAESLFGYEKGVVFGKHISILAQNEDFKNDLKESTSLAQKRILVKNRNGKQFLAKVLSKYVQNNNCIISFQVDNDSGIGSRRLSQIKLSATPDIQPASDLVAKRVSAESFLISQHRSLKKSASSKENSYFKQVDPETLFKIKNIIHRSPNGNIFQATEVGSGHVVAIRIIPATLMDHDQLVNAMSALKQAKSDYTVLYRGTFSKKDGTEWVVMEYCDMGSIKSVMDNKQVFQEHHIKAILFQVLNGIELLHSINRTHRKLGPSSILANSDGQCKISSFHFLSVIGTSQNGQDHKTTVWGAPETQEKEIKFDKIDIWHLGTTAIALAEGQPLSLDPSITKSPVLEGRPSLLHPENWSSFFVDFIDKCLQKEPSKRPTASELLKDPFFENVTKQSATKDLKDFFQKFHRKSLPIFKETAPKTSLWKPIKRQNSQRKSLPVSFVRMQSNSTINWRSPVTPRVKESRKIESQQRWADLEGELHTIED